MSLEGVNVSLLLQGKPIWTQAVSEGTAADGGTLTVHELADNRVAVHAVVPLKDGGRAEAVIVKTQGKTHTRMVWKARTDLAGDIGERIGKAVRFQDLTGDGKPEIVTGEVYEMVRLCGQKRLPLLFRSVYDPSKGVFRPVLAKRPGVDPSVDIAGDPVNDPPAAPLIEPLVPAGASRGPGDGGTAAGLSMPKETLDRNPATAWMPFPRNGAGEFITFRTTTDAYGLTRIGIRPLPTQTAAKKKAYDRPKQLILTTEKQAYRLTWNQDPASNPDAVYWFALPKAPQSHCLSLIVESSFAPSESALLPIAEVFAETEIDGPDGLSKLAADLNHAKRRRQAAMLLKRAGEPGVEAIRGAWKKLDLYGRRLAVGILAETDPKKSIPLLVEAVLGNDDRTKETAMKGLTAAPKQAVTGLSAYLQSADSAVFATAAGVLGELAEPSAVTALIGVTGQGDKKRRQVVRDLLAAIALRSVDKAEQLYAQLKAADDAGEREKMFDLLRAGASSPVLGDRIFEIAGRIYDGSTDFPDRYRALEAMGKVGCKHAATRLIAAAADGDKFIRKVAVEGLGTCRRPSKAVVSTIEHALTDDAPVVRLAGLDVLPATGLLSVSKGRIKALSRTEPWPVVRAKIAGLAKFLPPVDAFSILLGMADDDSALVRAAVLGSVVGVPGKAADAVVEGRLNDNNESTRIKLEAAIAAGKRCQATAVPALLKVLKIGAEPLARKEDIEVAVAAAKSLGAIGGTAAIEALKEAGKRSNLATDAAIENALEENGAACAKRRSPEKK